MFAWIDATTLPDCQVVAVARDDDTTFGILHSRFHELWALRHCTWLGVGNDPRYTPSTTFETFPFPEGLTPDRPASAYVDAPRAKAIAEAAERLNELRENWLNPSDLVEEVDEVVPGFPKRRLPRDERAAAILKTRTLTNLYNQRPAWLVQAHAALDAAVADAYGWPTDLSDEEVLERLLALNHARPAAGETKRRKGKTIDRRQGHLKLPLDGGKAKQAPSVENDAPETEIGSLRLEEPQERRKRGGER